MRRFVLSHYSFRFIEVIRVIATLSLSFPLVRQKVVASMVSGVTIAFGMSKMKIMSSELAQTLLVSEEKAH